MATLGRNSMAAEQAANAASEAARALQARQQELKIDAPKQEAADATPPKRAESKDSRGTEEKVIRRGNEDRDAAFDSIRAARGEKPPEQDIEKEAAKEVVAKAEPAPKPKVEQPAVTQDPDKTEPVTEPVVTAPEPKKVKVKIDGAESEVLESEVEEYGGIKPYQIAKASENRLAKLNLELAESKRFNALMLQTLQANKTPAEPQKTPDLRKQELVDIIRFGTPEESMKALDEYQGLTNPKVDTNALIQGAISETERRSAITRITSEFQDLNSNPMLSRLVISLAAERQPEFAKQPGAKDWEKFYRSICNEVRNGVGRQNQPSTAVVQTAATTAASSTGPTSTVSDKESRKESIVNLPTAAARAATPEEPKPKTRAESLNEMRKARGLPVG